MPVTNLAQRWNQPDWVKHPSPAQVEFLDPISPGLGKDEFMALLQDRIESHSIELPDLENPGALDPGDIGQVELNSVAQAREDSRVSQNKEIAT